MLPKKIGGILKTCSQISNLGKKKKKKREREKRKRRETLATK
jgi:hypothetical protein